MSRSEHRKLHGQYVSESTRKKLSEAQTGHSVSETKSGEKHPRAKLTYKKVERIRELLSAGKLKQAEIAIMFNISQVVISNIKNGKSWKT